MTLRMLWSIFILNKMAKERDKKMLWLVGILCLILIANLVFLILYFGVSGKTTTSDTDKGFLEKFDLDENANLSSKEKEVLSLEGFTEIDIEFNGEDSGVLISKRDRCEGVVVSIDPAQVFSIQQGMESKVSFRPTSHDTARDILDQYGINVLMVKITDIEGGAYIGRMILDGGEKITNLDIRPSDGVAIAVRTNSPIYLSESLLEDYGENVC